MWRDGVCERTITAHTNLVYAVAVLPGGARFVSGSFDRTAKLWTIDGAVERTFAVGSNVLSIAALPDGVHFVGLGTGAFERRPAVPRRRDARPHLQGAHQLGVWDGGDA